MKRAVISVSNKTGIVELGKGLTGLGFEIISTGGTFKTLKEAGVPVRYVTELTGFPEILDGRVKTLHPMIHAGILARDTAEHRQQLEENGIGFIDLVVVNLYPFQETVARPDVTFEDAIENIDIGGPTMVRAAAKNQERVAIVVNPKHYPKILESLQKDGEISYALRKRLAAEAFAHTADYDRAIADYLERQQSQENGTNSVFPQTLRLTAEKAQDLRYGENPQQNAAFYRNLNSAGTLAGGLQLQGKELSYNNWVDMDAAWSLVHEFKEPACIIIKHSNPCGAALGKTPLEAYERALEADPMSAFGGIMAFNRVVDAECARIIHERFYEVILAPEFSPEARENFQDKKNLRLVVIGRDKGAQAAPGRGWKIRTIQGGFLVQEEDRGTTPTSEWEVVTEQKPTAEDLRELEFAWQVVKHVKSNAIVLSKNGQTLGVGAGQMNRVGSVKISLEQAGDKAQGAYLASDAFFPFPDSLEEAARAGVRAVVQPGGSIKDPEVLEAANRLNLIMVFTHRRHFLH
ncbi:bifunctional phosphoribosylaminoimidazolecarboxamide formyltransferase/IMP cyclohydrolase [Desulfitobacterium sp.]|uniref:bifunctional phosphoribosylaminoimidazolecarboxamide formyltransferase/IMP cyclohydrolase n=1 Tax=Desulfitobacterium sp. TaxID=49981 RepID=UPI002C0169B5|nr:bifunctional phosphoribosylaminoimidazolecarboxamide formyltransferase/IMP cyclohydrolase [Desulfitobacterium sp.]HVJ49464.1 bifunctional phosphoribosylaminoimidazolecarboxamide formyltransferase/IMP cyclohydrolase [Desulfitobacterium sp.]